MKLWATSDLHVGYDENRRVVEDLPAYPDDWLIIAGDTGETPTHLDFVLKTLQPKFAQLIWAPGNHDLWTPNTLPQERRGVAHYERLVALCQLWVLTPKTIPEMAGRGPTRDRADVPAVRPFVPARASRVRARSPGPATGVRSADEISAPDHPP